MRRCVDAALLCLRVSAVALSLPIARAVRPVLRAVMPLVLWACTTWAVSGREIGRHPHDMSRSAAHREVELPPAWTEAVVEAVAGIADTSTGASQLRLFDDPLQAFRRRLLRDLAALAVSGVELLAAWVAVVEAEVQARFAANERTAQKAAAETARLFRFLIARGAETWSAVTAALVLEWCWAARLSRSGHHRRTKQSTARNRQWVALAAFEAAAALGAPVDPRALVGERIARPSRYVSARPLDDEEDHRARDHADAGLVASRRSLCLVFSYAGGTASEAAGVRWLDVDLDAATVAFRGAAARVGPLDQWSVETIWRFVRNNPVVSDGHPLCVTVGASTTRAAHSVTVRLGQVLRDAGIAGRPGVTARSIRLTTANRILQTDGIEAAARFLGSPSLDNTADALGYRWGPGGP